MIAPNFKSEKCTGVLAEVADADTWARGPASAAVAAAAAAAWSGTRSSGSGGGTHSQSRMLRWRPFVRALMMCARWRQLLQ